MIFIRCMKGFSRLFSYQLVITMKLIVLLTLVFSLHAVAESRAQKITLSVRNATLRDVMKQIQRQQGVSFLFRGSDVAKTRVTADLKDAEFRDAMRILVENQGLEWSREEGIVTISTDRKRTVSTVGSHKDEQLQHIVKGRILNEAGVPIQGATVTVKGSTRGVLTDEQGQFSIEIEKEGELEVRYVGFEAQTVPVQGRSSIDVVLRLIEDTLDEVVVVGFGTQKKESLVASVSTIKGDRLRMPNRSLSNNLAGQMPGIIAVQRSGEPGFDNAEFWIRGISSFMGGTSPLILVDGVPREMNDIEPDEIETFTLLKDAAATSVYGSEGANGVILITSKRGRIQKTTISYRGEGSHSTPTRTPRFANSFDYLSLYNESYRNDGQSETFTEEILNKYKTGEDPDLYPDVNWWEALMKDNTYNTRHTINFRGGGEKMRYFVSGAYFGESGLYKVNNEYNNNASVKRYNLRSNVDIDITKDLLLRADLSGQYLQVNRPPFDTDRLFTGIFSSPPHVIPVIYSDGSFSDNDGAITSGNPYNDLVEMGYRREWRSLIQSKIELVHKLDFWLDGLKARAALSYDANSTYRSTRKKLPDTYIATGRDSDGALLLNTVYNAQPFGNPTQTSVGDKNIYMETAVNYDQTFGRHTVGGMALYYQKDRQLSGNALAFRKQAWVGRATYNYDQRYIVEGNFSVTGSEQFAAGYRYGFFPAVGVAWNITNEPYYPSHLKNIVSGLKLRASVGKTGNDNTGADRFLYRPTFSNGPGYNVGIGSSGGLSGVGASIIEGRFEAPTLSWEIELKRNYGLDLTLFNGMVTVQADYFDNLRTNILLQRQTVSGVAGFQQNLWQNYGEVSNKGIDGSLNTFHRFGEFEVAFRGNFTFARNKILEMDEIPRLYPWMAQTGTRIGSMPGLVADRLFREDDFDIVINANGDKQYTLRDGIAPHVQHLSPKPGDVKYVDQNGDGIVDNNLDVIQGYTHPTVPEIIYGFGTNLSYKGFYTGFFFQGAGNVALNLVSPGIGQRTFTPFYEGLLSSAVRQEIIESRWTEDNPRQDVLYPRVDVNSRGNTMRASNTWFYRDAAFVRLKNVEIGYNFSSDLLKSLTLGNVRLYAMGQNIAVWDKVKVQDPEAGQSGGGAQYPLPRIWTVGLDITF